MLHLEWTVKLRLGAEQERDGATMSDWIKKKSAQLHAARKEQEHRREVLPAKAEDMWKGLLVLLAEDVEQINVDNELASRIRGRLDFQKLTDSAYQVVKDSLPTMRLKVVFNKHALTLSATRHEIRTPATRETDESLPPIRFDLDSQDNIFLTDSEGKKITLEKLSELWLSPFIPE